MQAKWNLALLAVFALALVANADDKGEAVTLKGTIACAKCTFKLDGVKSCQLAFKVTADKKDVYYFFDADSMKKYHGKDATEGTNYCTLSKDGTIKGTVTTDKAGQKWIKVTSLSVK